MITQDFITNIYVITTSKFQRKCMMITLGARALLNNEFKS